jgi:hypothetical protein
MDTDAMIPRAVGPTRTLSAASSVGWFVLFLFGVLLVSLGLATFLVHLYVTFALPNVFFYVLLQFVPAPARILLLVVVGTAAVVTAWVRTRQVGLAAERPRTNT